MPRNIQQLVEILEAQKHLRAISGWRPVNAKNELGSALEIEGVVEAGVSFRARCKPDLPEESVALMLFTETPAKQRTFARIDWRGTQHDNINPKLTGSQWGHQAGRTHFHDTRLHLHIDYETLFLTPHVDLPVAKAIAPEPSSFHQLLEISAKLLNIANLSEIPEPPWPQTRSLF